MTTYWLTGEKKPPPEEVAEVDGEGGEVENNNAPNTVNTLNSSSITNNGGGGGQPSSHEHELHMNMNHDGVSDPLLHNQDYGNTNANNVVNSAKHSAKLSFLQPEIV